MPPPSHTCLALYEMIMTRMDRAWYDRQPAPPHIGSRLADLGYHYFQRDRYIVELDRDGAIVYLAERSGAGWKWVMHVACSPDEIRAAIRGEVMASKFIKRAVAKVTKKSSTGLAMDPALGKDRPALTEFMTELEVAPGEPREVSPLMVTMSENGVRAGLKDEDAGGWCWREGKTFAEALDNIEKALQAGEGAFRAPRANKQQKRGRG